MNRAESLRIWNLIANGILYDEHQDGIPTEDFVKSVDFITDVAKKILEADETKIARGNAIMMAVKLQGKYTEHELEVLKIIELVKVLPPIDEHGNDKAWNRGGKNRTIIQHIRSHERRDQNPILRDLSLHKTDEELRKIIMRLED